MSISALFLLNTTFFLILIHSLRTTTSLFHFQALIAHNTVRFHFFSQIQHFRKWFWHLHWETAYTPFGYCITTIV